MSGPVPFSQFISCVAHRSADRPRVIPVTQPNVEAFVQGLGIWDGTTDATGPFTARQVLIRPERLVASSSSRNRWGKVDTTRSSNAQNDQLNKSDTDQQDRKRHGIVFEPMPIIGKHHVYPYSSQRRLRESLRGKMQPSC